MAVTPVCPTFRVIATKSSALAASLVMSASASCIRV